MIPSGMVEGMRAGERDMFQHGARLALADAQKGTAGAATRMLEKNWNKSKLAQVVGRQPADDFLQTVAREKTFANTGQKVTQGSDTAARHAAQKEFPNPIENAPLPHLTLSDLPVVAGRK